ncbi:MAG: c-type cytochrome, partial [Polyangiaceae bacterium]|nr:c-type cytochrome [Polyangiaceae bacterium]
MNKTTLSRVNAFEPAVAYQMVADPDEGVVLVHQYGNTTQVPAISEPNAYGQSGCGAISTLGLARVVGSVATQVQLGSVTLPVSVAMDDLGPVVIDAGALNDGSLTSEFLEDDGVLDSPFFDVFTDVVSSCGISARSVFGGSAGFRDGRQVVAVVSTPSGIWVQSRDPWQVVGPAVQVSLPGPNPKDSGHDLFHERAGASIACATCHAEGGDDGLVWLFDGVIPRRTHDLRGGILATAPFHWDGAHADMKAIMDDAFTSRMNGPFLNSSYAGAVATWVDSVAMPASHLGALDADVLAGKALFERADVGCASCHGAPLFTNNQSVDVGTGGSFQVPSLVGVGRRVSYLHDGCAPDLERAIRGEACTVSDFGAHGAVSSLSAAELAQLVAYLR